MRENSKVILGIWSVHPYLHLHTRRWRNNRNFAWCRRSSLNGAVSWKLMSRVSLNFLVYWTCVRRVISS